MAAAANNPGFSLHKPTVLVVEDDVLIRLSAAEALRAAGLAVVEAATGDEALTVLGSSATVDLVFTDIQMPGSVDGLPLGGRIVLLEPKAANRCTAQFFPAAMPADLATKTALRGEKRVWQALRRAPFPPGTRIFYNRAPKGCRRRADLLLLIPERGIIAIEVKGGLVQYRRGFRQRLAGPGRGAQRWHKRIEPWQQAGRALAHTLAALPINPLAIPQAAMLALPATRADAFPYSPGPHMLMAEDLAPALLAKKIGALLPRLDAAATAQVAPALDCIAAALTRSAEARHRSSLLVSSAFGTATPSSRPNWKLPSRSARTSMAPESCTRRRSARRATS